jgi:hypothetical protein
MLRLKMSALILIFALAVAWALAPGRFQSAATVRPLSSQPASVAVTAAKPAIAYPQTRIIAGTWTK